MHTPAPGSAGWIRPTEDDRERVASAVRAAVDDGRLDLDEAGRRLSATYRARTQGIYDGNFGRWPGARPFNWRLAEDDIGTARMVTAGDLPQSTALDVRYFGSTSGVLAEQYVFAEPGNYKLQLAARRRTTGATGGRMSMEVRCVGGEVIATLPLEPLDMQLRTMATPVAVPPGCQLLLVRLVGTPGEVFSEVEAQITAVALVRGG